MITIALSLVLFVLVAIAYRLARITHNQRATIKAQRATIRQLRAELSDWQSACLEWQAYSANILDRLHGVDSYPLPAIESKQLELVTIANKGTTKPIATQNLAGYALPANESKPNGNGHKSDGAQTSDNAPAPTTDSTRFTAILGALGTLTTDQNSRAVDLLTRWESKDGAKFATQTDEYIRRLKSALKL